MKKLQKEDHSEAVGAMEEAEKLELLVQEVDKQREKKQEYTRRRMHVDEKDVDYINERNKVFNEKLERNFSKFAAEIKGNIERGTAL